MTSEWQFYLSTPALSVWKEEGGQETGDSHSDMPPLGWLQKEYSRK